MAYRLVKVSETLSTNADAKAAAERGEPEGLVIQAERQMAGKGRQGRVWDSPAGNLYASLLLRPNCSAEAAGHYSFVTALAVQATLAELLPQQPVTLKWPNDVLVNGKKISGILLEAAPLSENIIPWLVIGVGINCLFHPQTGINSLRTSPLPHGEDDKREGDAARPAARQNYPTTSLLESGALQTNPDQVLTFLLTQLSAWQAIYQQQGFAPIRAAWLDRAQKGWLKARLPHCSYEGEFVDLDPHGRLIIRLADGTEQAIAAADIFLVP